MARKSGEVKRLELLERVDAFLREIEEVVSRGEDLTDPSDEELRLLVDRLHLIGFRMEESTYDK